MKIEEAKKIDIVSYLSSLGYQVSKISGQQFWFHSPLHDENTPSFKVNRQRNQWYDFGNGKGGDLLELGQHLFKCSAADFLKMLDNSHPTIQQFSPPVQQKLSKESSINITRVQRIRSLPLLRYLKERRIPQQLADKYLQEVTYSLQGKSYYALGFRNDAGGYELRNEYFKGSSSPKSPTTISIHGGQPHDTVDLPNQRSVAVFEGFTDFLSFMALASLMTRSINTFLILNSLSFFDKQLPRLQDYDKVHLFLDNDSAGDRMTAAALKMDPSKFQDERKLYHNYKDLNEWCQQQGKINRKQLKP